MISAAICAGTFDPPTDGHLNIVSRGLKVFDRIVIAVAINTRKTPIFTPGERLEMLREIFRGEPRV
jgi:pantetheine-phosphate adenylyltransferase